jgi:ribosome biogenesis GTPase
MTLFELGWGADFARAVENDRSGAFPARVAVAYRNRYLLFSEQGELDAIAVGALAKAALEGGAGDSPVAGDWVLARRARASGRVDGGVRSGSDGPAIILRLLPRRSAFTRKPAVSGGRKLQSFEGETRIAGGEAAEQVIAANVDLAAIVVGLDAEFSPRRIRRYLIGIERSGAKPLVILNKIDLGDPQAALRAIAEVAPGTPRFALSAKTGAGIPALKALLEPGITVALVGSSGTGKSSIANALVGAEVMAIQAKSDSTGKGRHTTSRRELIPVPGGGLILDTPGMREMQLWADEEDIAAAFPSLQELAAACRFTDCSHGPEPGCAVRAAIKEGRLDQALLEEYAKLSRETRYLSLRRVERSRARGERELFRET